jgi:hypothetical protein
MRNFTYWPGRHSSVTEAALCPARPRIPQTLGIDKIIMFHESPDETLSIGLPMLRGVNEMCADK